MRPGGWRAGMSHGSAQLIGEPRSPILASAVLAAARPFTSPKQPGSCYILPATVLNVVLRLVPIKVNEPIAATAISAAIKLYSIAVTPLSSASNRVRIFISNLLCMNHSVQVIR